MPDTLIKIPPHFQQFYNDRRKREREGWEGKRDRGKREGRKERKKKEKQKPLDPDKSILNEPGY